MLTPGFLAIPTLAVFLVPASRALPEGIEVTFESAEPGENGSNASVAAPAPQVYDMVLQAVGRTPNGKKLRLKKLLLR